MDDVARRVTQVLADRLARLSLAGGLRIDNPEMAATQLATLLTGSLDTRSRLGTRCRGDVSQGVRELNWPESSVAALLPLARVVQAAGLGGLLERRVARRVAVAELGEQCRHLYRVVV